MKSGIILYGVTGGIMAGVALGSFGFASSVAIVSTVLAVVACLIAATFRVQKIILLALVLAAVALGSVRFTFYQNSIAQESLAQFNNQKVLVVGTVVNDPELSGSYVHANIDVMRVSGTSAKGTLLAFAPQDARLSYGDQVIIAGKMQNPAAFMGDNGNMFDYPGYLRVQGVSMTLFNANILSQTSGGFSIHGALFALKHSFDHSLERVLPQPEANLLEGILFGQRRGLPQDITQAFVIAGLIHIVILSGYSMSVVSEGVLRGLFFLPKTFRFIIGGALMILFVLMTGGAATTTRACAMALVALTARYLHRSAVAMRALFAVACAMVLYNPPILLSDASFIVSVLATFGLIIFAPYVEKILWRVPHHFELRSIITSTIAVQIFALPILLYYTGNVSLLSVPANLLVLPLLPFIMIAGLLTGLLGYISTTLALIPGIVVLLLLRFILLVVSMVNAIPFAAASLHAFPFWAALLCYVPLTALAILLLVRTVSRTRTN